MNNPKGPLPSQGDLEALLVALGAMRQSPNGDVESLPPGLQGAITPGSPGFMKLPQIGVPGGIPSNSIPKAKPNASGMTRLSPGMYKNKDGKIVRSVNGRPSSKGY